MLKYSLSRGKKSNNLLGEDCNESEMRRNIVAYQIFNIFYRLLSVWIVSKPVFWEEDPCQRKSKD